QRLAAFGVIQALRQPFDGWLIEHRLLLLRHGVTKDADPSGFHLDDVAWLEPARRREPGAGPGRGAGRDHVAGFEGGKGGEVGDQEIERKHQPLGGIALAHLAIDAGYNVMRSARIAFVRRDDPRPDAARAIEILALRNVELAVVQPVADAALVAQRHAEDVVPGALARDVPSLFADHDHKLAFIVELFGDIRLFDRLTGADDRGGVADKQARILRQVRIILVLGV